MRLFFAILSIIYIAAIFLLADSSVVSKLAPFNPYSLLHIPLYGILSLLLVFSISPFELPRTSRLSQVSQMSRRNGRDRRNHFMIAGFIALMVAIADEIHQAYVPGRDASITDVLLDTIGIVFVLSIVYQAYKKQTSFRL